MLNPGTFLFQDFLVSIKVCIFATEQNRMNYEQQERTIKNGRYEA